MKYEAVVNYLYALRSRKSKYGLERMRAFADALGNPQDTLPIIHVAGTNGKGSVCAMLESIYACKGYKTGLFTSPHLIHLGERIQVNRQPLSPDAFCQAIPELKRVAEGLSDDDPDRHPTFFEFITVLAFQVYAEREVDIAIVETGLGGRLDASNIIKPAASVITSIALDHCEILGDTLEAIATEKAGIIKNGIPVIIGLLPPEAEQVIRSVADEREAPLYSVREHYGDDLSMFPKSSLEGEFQRMNAATASLTVDVCKERFPVEENYIEDGLKSVKWGGRWQSVMLDNGTVVILDSTHNREGAQYLRKNLEDLYRKNGYKPVLVVGTTNERRAEELKEAVSACADRIYVVCPGDVPAVQVPALEKIMKGAAPTIIASDTASLFPEPGKTAIEDAAVVVVSGSVYLVGEVLSRLQALDYEAEMILQG